MMMMMMMSKNNQRFKSTKVKSHPLLASESQRVPLVSKYYGKYGSAYIEPSFLFMIGHS